MIKLFYNICFCVYFLCSLLCPDSWFKKNKLQYVAFINEVNVSRRLTRLADLCNYDSNSIYLWIAAFCVLWKKHPVFKVDFRETHFQQFEPPGL